LKGNGKKMETLKELAEYLEECQRQHSSARYEWVVYMDGKKRHSFDNPENAIDMATSMVIDKANSENVDTILHKGNDVVTVSHGGYNTRIYAAVIRERLESDIREFVPAKS